MAPKFQRHILFCMELLVHNSWTLVPIKCIELYSLGSGFDYPKSPILIHGPQFPTPHDKISMCLKWSLNRSISLCIIHCSFATFSSFYLSVHFFVFPLLFIRFHFAIPLCFCPPFFCVFFWSVFLQSSPSLCLCSIFRIVSSLATLGSFNFIFVFRLLQIPSQL